MKFLDYFHNHKTERGQSLVEVSLFLPLFLILIAGVVEVGQLLVTQNRVLTATNASTRFASNGGENDGMAIVALRTITETLPPDTGRWDVWAIRGVVNEQGTGISDDSWEFAHIYGDGSTQDFSEVDEATVKVAVYEELQKDASGNLDQSIAADTEFVATLALFDADSILGLEFFLEDIYSVQALNVMRTFPSTPVTNGCTGFPIAVEEGVRSLASDEFPDEDDFDYPDDDDAPEFTDFPNNTPDTPLLNAKPGDIFLVQNGSGSGNFGWISWNEYKNQSANNLAGSLSWPGDSMDYSTDVPGQTPPGYAHGVNGFIENGDESDNSLHVGDRVTGHTGAVNANSVRNALEDNIMKGRTLRLIVWREAEGPGSNAWYRISGFVVMRLHGYKLSQGQGGSWILAEYVGWDESCGQTDSF